MDPAAFAKTMETWNGCVESKNDPDFGRTSFATPLNNGPFYAIKVTAGVQKQCRNRALTLGQIKNDDF